MDQAAMMKRVMEIQRDPNLTDAEKAVRRQQLMSGKWAAPAEEEGDQEDGAVKSEPKPEHGLSNTLQCTICHELCNRPVTAPCQHNFCLKCFQDHVNKSKKKCCPTCRTEFSAKFCANPRINTALTMAIRAFKIGTVNPSSKPFERINDADRPDEAFTTDRAVRAGRANAASGRIMVTVPNDHFGPIPASADPRGTGIKVGEWWKDRLDCRQWGAHFPHVAGIAGQSNVGAQSVVLSGGYEDDRDEGEWFLYTGSGGRDLSGNKRTSKVQSFDQTFDNMNKALKLSCTKGLPVRVVRSYKEKRSAYAPGVETPVRYDGVYRIVRCWRKPGAQGPLMCRYLFMRCDNEPAPWSSEGEGVWDHGGVVAGLRSFEGAEADNTGDRPVDDAALPAPALEEMKQADKGQVYSMADKPWWGWLEDKQEWGWTRAAPVSQQRAGGEEGGSKTVRKRLSEQERALREFACGICKKTVVDPVSTPCGHNFCKACLDKKFAGIADEVAGGGHAAGIRSIRVRKQLKPCPTCKTDLMEFLKGAAVNRDMAEVVAKLQESIARAREEASGAAGEEGEEGVAAVDEGGEEGVAGVDEEAEEGAGVSDGEGASDAAIVSEDAAPAAAPEQPASSAETGPREPAISAHQVEALSPIPPSVPAPPSQQDKVTVALIEEYEDFDAGLIQALMEQEDNDEAAVRYCLRRMRAQVAAEAKKQQKQAQLVGASAGGDKAMASEVAPAAEPAVAGGRAKRARR
ncbi:E3 ubiquitin-protein ligase ORTHRUS 2 [Auxenochlorella protothecoides]|uniref:E3 ubiquitin-protein ligase ORTHRUS 2 n=1 Tax=Auxenochlorella protothecoides TaxID=3075 RepID=A0A087SU54_AUXPR|nr:E3 ubiquitin-protein ligase ORTHRUS 2 [Auxenochlorella protothecoides]KFM29258.1 E3 ubiquitin-protein ligase ORTHRUS 2 [Auxenochlorella protothecoides]